MVRLNFSRRYSMAHRLLHDPSSKCRTPHGHDEVVTIRLRPLTPMDLGGGNMSAAFSQAKGTWHAWIDGFVDHALQLNAEDPLLGYFQREEPAQLTRIMVFNGDPTTEALAIAFFRKLSAILAAEALFAVEEISVQETPTNAVTLTAADLDALGGWTPGDWALRPDASLNDLLPAAAWSRP
jgi:6-pyruvoyltetrahydropterin/6-carboxytetrahydropterin synthase